MAESTKKTGFADVFLTLGSNQVFVTVATIAGVLLAIWVFIGPARELFSDAVDNIRAFWSSVFGKPASQVTSDRTKLDNLTGLFAEEDRALSDLVDSPLGFFGALLFGSKSDKPSGL